MNHCFFFTLAICLLSGSNALAQDFLKQFGQELRSQIQQELQPQRQNQPVQGGGRPQIQSSGVPSESGRDSGGGNFTNPGNDFALPGRGVQPVQPGFPGGRQEIVQPGQPVYRDRQPVQPGGQWVQPGGQIVQPGGRIIYPSSNQPIYVDGQPSGTTITNSVPYTGSDLPGSPVMTKEYVMIRCPASTVGSISYLLSSSKGNFRFTMSGGQEQRFKTGTKWTIEYNDGNAKKRYKLFGGKTYTMKREADNRWQVYVTKAAGS